jgi:hypothetical protein
VPVQAERSEFIGRAWTGADGWRIDDLKGEVGSVHILSWLSLTAALCPASIRTRLGRLLSPVHVGVPLPGVLLSTERSRREDVVTRSRWTCQNSAVTQTRLQLDVPPSRGPHSQVVCVPTPGHRDRAPRLGPPGSQLRGGAPEKAG